MERLRNWSVSLATLAFVALPLMAAGCAGDTAEAPPAGGADAPADTLDDLPSELGEPESGSGLGLPESGSALE